MFITLLKRTKLADRLRAATRHEVEQALKPLRKEVQRLSEEVERQKTTLDHLKARDDLDVRAATQLKMISTLNVEQHDLIEELPALLNEERVLAHVRHAIASAEIRRDPCDHIVVQGLLPDAVYDVLIKAIPPPVFFHDRDPIKQNIVFPITFGPALTVRVWNFMDEVVSGRGIMPAVVEKFHEPLQQHYDTIFGPDARERANQLPRYLSGGRLMLRKPGYHLSPHRDPKRSFVTCLMYLARPGDSETYGTQLFRVTGDSEANYKQTYYPQDNGHATEVAAVVPFRPNTMLVFVNSRGAHGATIPPDAPPELERYSYQFYVAPQNEALSALIKTLPSERRKMWQNKNKLAEVGA
jgi:hypothetical protein